MKITYKAKEDCFAYDKVRHNCRALKEMCCRETGECKFYKTKIQFLRGASYGKK